MRLVVRVLIVFSLIVSPAFATIFGTVRGTITDAQQNPMSDARVVLTARNSQWQQTAHTDAAGTFAFQGVPLGEYTLRAEARGVAARKRAISVTSSAVVQADLALPLATASGEVSVTATAALVDPRSSTTQTTVSRIDVQRTPGADRTNSLSMITNFVPSASIVHDQLHIRGGHQ